MTPPIEAGRLQIGDICIPLKIKIADIGLREPLPCRVESIGRTVVGLKELFGRVFYVDKDAPCRLLSSK